MIDAMDTDARRQEADRTAAEARADMKSAGRSRPDQHKHLANERERLAERLYEVGRERREARPSPGEKRASERYRKLDREHASLEARWNGLRQEEIQLHNEANAEKRARGERAKDKTYTYKSDRRDNFIYEEKTVQTPHGDRRERKSKGELGRPSETINWRADTKVGKRIHERVRQRVGRGVDDDAGHLIGCQFGADPAESYNIGAQNFVQNQGRGTWHYMERCWANELEANKGASIHVVLSETYDEKKYGDRARQRDASIKRTDAKGASATKQTFMNSHTYSKEGRGLKAASQEKPGDIYDIGTGCMLTPSEVKERQERAAAISSKGGSNRHGMTRSGESKSTSKTQSASKSKLAAKASSAPRSTLSKPKGRSR